MPAADFPHSPDLLVTLDAGSPDRLGSLADRIGRAGRTVVIDHHASGVAYGDLRLVDDGAAATVVLVAELLDRLVL